MGFLGRALEEERPLDPMHRERIYRPESPT
jgi:hypothetical protein